jgi:hypothetical protein
MERETERCTRKNWQCESRKAYSAADRICTNILTGVSYVEHWATPPFLLQLQTITEDFSKYSNPFPNFSFCKRIFEDLTIVYEKTIGSNPFANGSTGSRRSDGINGKVTIYASDIYILTLLLKINGNTVPHPA